jgi:hypothetical protein
VHTQKSRAGDGHVVIATKRRATPMAIPLFDLPDGESHEGKALIHFPSEETGILDSHAWCTPRGRALRGAVMSEVHVPVFRASIKCPSPITTLRP